MEPIDLSLCTTGELIDELMRRKTFLGVVIHSQKELKQPHCGGEQTFRVHFNDNLTGGEVSQLLSQVAEHMLLNYGLE